MEEQKKSKSNVCLPKQMVADSEATPLDPMVSFCVYFRWLLSETGRMSLKAGGPPCSCKA